MSKYFKFSTFIISIILMLNIVSVSADDDKITRLEAVYMISELININENVGDEYAFWDVKDKNLNFCRKKALVNGMEKDYFYPNSSIRTQDFLVMLKRFMDYASPNIFYDNQKVIKYSDNDIIKDYAKPHIDMLTSVGVYSGDGFLNPMLDITKKQANDFLMQAKAVLSSTVKSENGKMPKKMPKVLMYHFIGQTADETLCVSPENFEEQIKYLSENGYTFLFPEELSMADSLPKSIVITFDDGYDNNYYYAFETLKKYNAKATIFFPSDFIGKEGYCTAEQVKNLSDSGLVRIYSHTKTHSNLAELSLSDAENELRTSNDVIYNITKREVTSLSFPYGRLTDDIRNLVKRYYKTAFSVYLGKNTILDINRVGIEYRTDLDKFKKIIEN